MTQQVMNKAEGAVIHLQLDAMIKALAAFDNAAGEAGDSDVLALMARLHEAREAAQRVACRRPLDSQGVILTKS